MKHYDIFIKRAISLVVFITIAGIQNAYAITYKVSIYKNANGSALPKQENFIKAWLATPNQYGLRPIAAMYAGFTLSELSHLPKYSLINDYSNSLGMQINIGFHVKLIDRQWFFLGAHFGTTIHLENKDKSYITYENDYTFFSQLTHGAMVFGVNLLPQLSVYGLAGGGFMYNYSRWKMPNRPPGDSPFSGEYLQGVMVLGGGIEYRPISRLGFVVEYIAVPNINWQPAMFFDLTAIHLIQFSLRLYL